jgi:hypothetical protein
LTLRQKNFKVILYHSSLLSIKAADYHISRPLRIEELAEAAVINPHANPPFNPEDRLRDPHSDDATDAFIASIDLSNIREGRANIVVSYQLLLPWNRLIKGIGQPYSVNY